MRVKNAYKMKRTSKTINKLTKLIKRKYSHKN